MKIIEFLQDMFSPLGFVWLVLIVMAVVGFRRRQVLTGSVAAVSALMLAVVGNLQFAREYLVDMEQPYKQVNLSNGNALNNVTVADAVVVLNWDAMGNSDSTIPVSYYTGGERVILGAELVNQDKARYLVMPDNNADVWNNSFKGKKEDDFIYSRFDIEKQQVLKMPANDDVYMQAVTVARLAAIYEWKSIHVVTSAIEMDRAVAVFKKMGLNAIPMACDFRTGPAIETGIVNIIPDAEAVDMFSSVLSEKMLVRRYRMRGWI